jgi:hypothetical protein
MSAPGLPPDPMQRTHGRSTVPRLPVRSAEEGRMLAYVFWHWRSPAIDAEAYKNRLITFHRVPAERRPAGFQDSVVFFATGAPWPPTALEAYGDRYFMDGSAVLDPLNEATVSRARRGSHGEVARGAAGGVGGLYRLRPGDPSLANSEARCGSRNRRRAVMTPSTHRFVHGRTEWVWVSGHVKWPWDRHLGSVCWLVRR